MNFVLFIIRFPDILARPTPGSARPRSRNSFSPSSLSDQARDLGMPRQVRTLKTLLDHHTKFKVTTDRIECMTTDEYRESRNSLHSLLEISYKEYQYHEDSLVSVLETISLVSVLETISLKIA